jgi:hypothetical protein
MVNVAGFDAETNPIGAALAQATRQPTIRPTVTQQAGNENAVIPPGMPGVPELDRATITAAPDQSALVEQLQAVAAKGQARTFLEGAGTMLAPTLLAAILGKEDKERKAGANLATIRALTEEEGLEISDGTFAAIAADPALAASIIPALFKQNLVNKNEETFTPKFDKSGKFIGQSSNKSQKFTEAKQAKSIWRPMLDADGKQIGIQDQYGDEKLRPVPKLSFDDQVKLAKAKSTKITVEAKKGLHRSNQAANDAAAYGKELFDAGKAARNQGRELDLFETALDLGGQTGKTQESVDFLRNAAISTNLLTSEEAIKLGTLQDIIGAISQKQAFAEKPEASGSVSNFEQQIFRLAAIGMSKTVEGNRALIKFKRKILQRKIDDAKELASKMAEPRNADGTINQEEVGLFPKNIRAMYMTKPDVFSKEDMKELLGFASSENDIKLATLLDTKYKKYDKAKMSTLDWQTFPKPEQEAYQRQVQRLYNQFHANKGAKK